MSEISHVVEYYEGLHLRRSKKEFSIQEEINWILLNGEDSTKIVDMYLCLDATINMDIDSTTSPTFKNAVRAKGRLIYKAIKKVNQQLGEDLLSHQDK
tara:strand:- start:10920 stop:11213 length:294 start_codon:yes stop_codon:yes gene_type:complete